MHKLLQEMKNKNFDTRHIHISKNGDVSIDMEMVLKSEEMKKKIKRLERIEKKMFANNN